MVDTEKVIKALGWLIQNFPVIENPKNDAEKMCNCINLYCQNARDLINRQHEELELSRKFQIKEIHIDDELCKECQYETKQVISETIKEFAKRLKRVKVHSLERHENVVPVAQIDWVGQWFIKEKWEEIK